MVLYVLVADVEDLMSTDFAYLLYVYIFAILPPYTALYV